MYFVFYNTNDVFVAEERLQEQKLSIEVVPTPVQDKAYCGVCVMISERDESTAMQSLAGMDYKVVK